MASKRFHDNNHLKAVISVIHPREACNYFYDRKVSQLHH